MLMTLFIFFSFFLIFSLPLWLLLFVALPFGSEFFELLSLASLPIASSRCSLSNGSLSDCPVIPWSFFSVVISVLFFFWSAADFCYTWTITTGAKMSQLRVLSVSDRGIRLTRRER